MDSHLSHVVLDTPSSETAQDVSAPLHFDDVTLLVVTGDKLHVWVNGTHYIGDGTADSVTEGDVFYQATPEVAVFKVIGVDEGAASGDLGVEIEYVYDTIDAGDGPHTDQVSLDALTGRLTDTAMGDSGPPQRLERQ